MHESTKTSHWTGPAVFQSYFMNLRRNHIRFEDVFMAFMRIRINPPPTCLSIFLCSLYFSRPSHHLICLSFSPPPLLHLSRPTVSHLSFPSLLQRWYLFRPAGQKEEVPEQEKEPDHRLVSAERLPLQEVQTGEFTHTPEVTQKGPCELRTHQEKID